MSNHLGKKTIELVKDKDGVYREGKTEPKQAAFKNPVRSRVSSDGRRKRDLRVTLVETVAQELNNTLEEIGMKALNELTRGFFR